jgi:integrase
VLAAVREFFKVRADRPGLRLRSRPRHKLSEPQRVVDAASDEEVLALLKACRNARDRFIVLALWRIGNRRGELTGIRMEDVHFVPDATRLGCRVRGEHLHVHRRANPNGAVAKSRRSRPTGSSCNGRCCGPASWRRSGTLTARCSRRRELIRCWDCANAP